MKVLFVSAGTRAGIPAEVVKNQGESLSGEGVELKHFCIGRGGLWGYLRALPRIRREIRLFRPDVVHAHYSLSAFIAALSGFRPVVASIMGSETNGYSLHRLLIRVFIKFFWTETIVKTRKMALQLRTEEVHIIPNGVNTDRFVPMNEEEAMARTTLERGKTNIIFVSNPGRPEKNWQLAVKAVALLNDESIKLTAVFGVNNSDLVCYYSSASLLLLTSKWEGSPNVVKEAMACNCPVVSTDVGDVRAILSNTEGTYLTSFDCTDVAEKLSEAIKFARTKGRTQGREKIFENELDSKSISKKLIGIYISVTKKMLNH
jgi:teichuronic acid biosynthesis glycosyltransferase TuaC